MPAPNVCDSVAEFYGMNSQTGKTRSSFAAANHSQAQKKAWKTNLLEDKKMAATSSPRRPVSAKAAQNSPRRPASARATVAAQNQDSAPGENQLLEDTFNVHSGRIAERMKNGEARPPIHDTCPWRPDGSDTIGPDLHSCDLQAAARKRLEAQQRPVSARVARPASAHALRVRPPSASVATATVGRRQEFLLQCVNHGHTSEQIERLIQQFDHGSAAVERSAPIESASVPHKQESAPYAQAMPPKASQGILRAQRALHTQTPCVKPYKDKVNDPEQLHNAFVDAHRSFEAIKDICSMGNGQFLTHEIQMHPKVLKPNSLMAKRARKLQTPSIKFRGHDSKVSCNAYVAGRQNASDFRTRDRSGNSIF